MKRIDLVDRLMRLEQLSLGLAKEIHLIAKGNDPMLRAERLEYLRSMRAALAGIEVARVTERLIEGTDGEPPLGSTW